DAAALRFAIQRFQIFAVRRELFGGWLDELERPPALHGAGGSRDIPYGNRRAHVDRQRLLSAGHRQIDFGEQLRVQQRAMQRSMSVGDRKTVAKRIETVALPGKRFASERKRVDER